MMLTAIRQSQADQERELIQARDFMEVICTIRKLPPNSFRLDRCRHESNHHTSLWLFDAAGAQVAAVVRDLWEMERGHEAWTAKPLYRGMPAAAWLGFSYLYNALDYASRPR